jgi:molecular chaperone DnaK (HSP70)
MRADELISILEKVAKKQSAQEENRRQQIMEIRFCLKDIEDLLKDIILENDEAKTEVREIRNLLGKIEDILMDNILLRESDKFEIKVELEDILSQLGEIVEDIVLVVVFR